MKKWVVDMSNKNVNHTNLSQLDERSRYLRRLVIRAFEGGMRGHLGSSMSLIEILRYLYDDWLNYDPNNPNWGERDRCILSKGHGCLALYAILADKNFFPKSELDLFCHAEGILGGHPDKNKVAGIEASTGALGHGLSIGVGMALSAKIKSAKNRVVVITGDGEINEGSIWEAAMSASKHKLNNFIWVVDYNKLQSYGLTSEVLDLEPLTEKMKSFGFAVQNINGHEMQEIATAFSLTANVADKPSAIICHTIKGKGFPFAEQNPSWHHKAKLSEEQIQQMYDCVGEAV